MADGRLFLGSRRYSSWSFRGWLAVRLAGLDVEEVVLPLRETRSPDIAAASPSGLVPYLEHRGVRVWDSLAIAEYCAELAPGLWPADRGARAHARSIAAEMHAGFRGLRMAMPMNLGRSFPGWAAPRRHWPTSPASRRFGQSVLPPTAGRSCSGPASALPTPSTPRW